MEPGDSSMAYDEQGWFMNGQGWLTSRHAAEVSQAFFLTEIIGQFIASCPVADFIGHSVTSRTGRARCESTTPHRYEFA